MWSGLRTLAMSAIGAYAIAALVQGPLMPWIGFVFLMGHMSVKHVQRMRLDEAGAIDITGLHLS